MARILIIDDDIEILEMLCEMLKRDGHDVLEALDGKKGITLLEKERVDLVVTDIIMPGKEGLETITDLRRDMPEVKIVAMSGGGERVGQKDCLGMALMLGAKRVLFKPFTREELLETIGEVLNEGSYH